MTAYNIVNSLLEGRRLKAAGLPPEDPFRAFCDQAEAAVKKLGVPDVMKEESVDVGPIGFRVLIDYDDSEASIDRIGNFELVWTKPDAYEEEYAEVYDREGNTGYLVFGAPEEGMERAYEHATKRVQDYLDGRWEYLMATTIVCGLDYGRELAQSQVKGIESDTGQAYFQQVAVENASEALYELREKLSRGEIEFDQNTAPIYRLAVNVWGIEVPDHITYNLV